MKNHLMNDNKGLTLVELIVSFAIISLLAVTMLNIFSTGLFTIYKSGNRTINTETAGNNFITSPAAVSDEITLTIDLGVEEEDSIEVKGRIGGGSGSIPGNYGNIKVDIEAFIPGL